MMFKLFAIVSAASIVSTGIAFPKNDAKPTDIKTCFDGYTLTPKGVCVQEVDEFPRPYCPSGEIDPKGCRVQVPKIKRCPDGYTLDSNGNCSYPTTTELRYFCPAGFIDDGEGCVQKLPGETIDFCVDSDRVGDRCVRLLKAEPQVSITCPDGATLEDGSCWRSVETFDCTGDFTCTTKCKEPHCKNGKNLRRLHGEDALVPVSAPKQYKVAIVSQICQKKFEVPTLIQQSCPEGFMDDGTSCFREEILPLQSECVATGGPVQTCPPIVNYAPKVTRCADGTPGVKGVCTELVIGEGIEYCPKGFVDNGVACEGFLEAPLECPPDLVLKNGRCTGKRIHPAVIVEATEEVESTAKPLVIGKELRVFHHAKSKL